MLLAGNTLYSVGSAINRSVSLTSIFLRFVVCPRPTYFSTFSSVRMDQFPESYYRDLLVGSQKATRSAHVQTFPLKFRAYSDSRRHQRQGFMHVCICLNVEWPV